MTKKQMINRLVLLTVLLLCAGCGKKNEGAIPVRIAYFPNITHSQALVMKEKRSVEDKLGNACKVSWISFNAGPAEVEAMFAGEVDLGYIGPVPAINAYVKSGGDVKIIANACNGGAVLVKSKSADINSVTDLNGKKVAVPQLGNTQHLCLLNLLKENGLSAKSDGGTVLVVAAENADLQGLLEQGEIDAALVPEPWGSILEEQCSAEILLDYDEVFMNGKYPTAVVIVNNDFYTEHLDIVASFLEVHKEATLYINNNPEDAIKIISKQIKEVTGKSYNFDLIKNAFQKLEMTDDISEAALRAFGEIGLQQGFVSEIPKEDLSDTTLMEKLKK